MNTEYRIRRAVGAAVLVAAVGTGLLAGTLIARNQTYRTIPVLMAPNTVQAAYAKVSFQEGFAPVVKHVVPAVVNISSSRIVRTETSPFFSDPFFRQFFGQGSAEPSKRREEALGSGVIFSPDGYIITNNHVIEKATDIKVVLADGREFKAKLVGTDAKTDIAVLKVAATGLPALPFGDSSKMEPGNFVIAVGNPFGLKQTVTSGIVSAVGRSGLGIEGYEDFIQTDAAINPGNSGGALVDVDGNLVGINTAILSGSGGSQGVGFAIPVNMARQVMDEILKNGKVIRGYMGVEIQNLTPEMAQAFGLKETRGALIADVSPDSPASRAGLQRGDVVSALNGQAVTSQQLQLRISMLAPGTKVDLTVWRNGHEMHVPVTLVELPSGKEAQGGTGGGSEGALEGLSVETLTPDIARQLQLPSGTKGVVVDSVDPASSAASAGIQKGDVIQEVNRKPVSDVAQFNEAVRAAGANKPVLLLINRNGSSTYVVLQPQ